MSLITWKNYTAGEYHISCPDCCRGSYDQTVLLVMRENGVGSARCPRCGFTESNLDKENALTITPAAATGPSLAVEPLEDGVVIVSGADMRPEPINWLWKGYLPRGKVALLAGEPGTGKTTIANSFAATVARGQEWPDGALATPGNVVIWSGEDDPEDTLTPRLLAAGADMNRIFFVTGTRIKGKVRSFDPARDTPALKDVCTKIGDVRLLIVDPIVSAVAGDSHRNTETRRALQPLVDLAASVGAALLGITHFNKGKHGNNPAQWVNGSVAFTAVARVVMIAAKVECDEGNERRIFARAKSNLGADDGGFEYQVEQREPIAGIKAPCIMWGQEVVGSALELLASQAKDAGRRQSAVGEAKKFLARVLDAGELPVKSIEAEAETVGIALRTLRRASDLLEVVKQKGSDGKWYWSLLKSSNMVSKGRLEEIASLDSPASYPGLRLVPKPIAD